MSYQIYSDVRECKLPFPSCHDSTCMWILANCKMLAQWITTMLDKDYISGRDTITMPAPRHAVWRSACGELVILHVPVSSYRLGAVYKHVRDDNEPRSFARRLITFGVTSHQGLLYYDIVHLIRSEYCHILLLSHTWILTPDEKQHSFEKCAVTTDRKKALMRTTMTENMTKLDNDAWTYWTLEPVKQSHYFSAVTVLELLNSSKAVSLLRWSFQTTLPDWFSWKLTNCHNIISSVCLGNVWEWFNILDIIPIFMKIKHYDYAWNLMTAMNILWNVLGTNVLQNVDPQIIHYNNVLIFRSVPPMLIPKIHKKQLIHFYAKHIKAKTDNNFKIYCFFKTLRECSLHYLLDTFFQGRITSFQQISWREYSHWFGCHNHTTSFLLGPSALRLSNKGPRIAARLQHAGKVKETQRVNITVVYSTKRQ